MMHFVYNSLLLYYCRGGGGGFPKFFKGFDTIDYEILLGKWEHRGIRSLALKWIKTRFHRFPILAIFFLLNINKNIISRQVLHLLCSNNRSK